MVTFNCKYEKVKYAVRQIVKAIEENEVAKLAHDIYRELRVSNVELKLLTFKWPDERRSFYYYFILLLFPFIKVKLFDVSSIFNAVTGSKLGFVPRL